MIGVLNFTLVIILSVAWVALPLAVGVRPLSWNAAASQCLFGCLFVSILVFLWSPRLQVRKIHLVGLVVAGLVAQFVSVETTAEVQKSGSGGHGLACGGISTVVALALAVSLAVVIRKVATRFGLKSYLTLGLLVVVATSSVNLYCPVSTYTHAGGHATGYLLAVLILYLFSAVPAEFQNKATSESEDLSGQ